MILAFIHCITLTKSFGKNLMPNDARYKFLGCSGIDNTGMVFKPNKTKYLLSDNSDVTIGFIKYASV